MNPSTYIVAGGRPWSRAAFEEEIRTLPGRWFYIDAPEALSLPELTALKPRTIFFLHWSWKVPDDIVKKYECVCFHPTDLPFGRGGSPIQNLILRGIEKTYVTAFQMTPELDAGPIYLKRPMGLEGRGQEIYERFVSLSAKMISEMIQRESKPVPQQGEVVSFKRRKPEESELPKQADPKALYDFIRMLDAEGYPKAFVPFHGLRLEFSHARLENGKLTATVTVVPDAPPSPRRERP